MNRLIKTKIKFIKHYEPKVTLKNITIYLSHSLVVKTHKFS